MQSKQARMPVDPSEHTQRQKNARWALIYVLTIVPLDAFTVWLLWGMFIVPLGVIAISYWHALGLSTFASYMLQTGSSSAPLPPNVRQITKRHITTLIGALMLAIIARLLMR